MSSKCFLVNSCILSCVKSNSFLIVTEVKINLQLMSVKQRGFVQLVNTYKFYHKCILKEQGREWFSWEKEYLWHHATQSWWNLEWLCFILSVNTLLAGSIHCSKIIAFLGSKITVDGDCSHEIKRRLFLGRKALTNLGSILKSRDITLPTRSI